MLVLLKAKNANTVEKKQCFRRGQTVRPSPRLRAGSADFANACLLVRAFAREKKVMGGTRRAPKALQCLHELQKEVRRDDSQIPRVTKEQTTRRLLRSRRRRRKTHRNRRIKTLFFKKKHFSQYDKFLRECLQERELFVPEECFYH